MDLADTLQASDFDAFERLALRRGIAVDTRGSAHALVVRFVKGAPGPIECKGKLTGSSLKVAANWAAPRGEL